MQLICRDAEATNDRIILKNEQDALKRGHQHIADRMHKVDKIDEVTTQFRENTVRLDNHETAINLKSITVERILKNLEELKLKNEKKVSRAEEQHDALLKELRKGNETKINPQLEDFPPPKQRQHIARTAPQHDEQE